jgi:hypothetical protein
MKIKREYIILVAVILALSLYLVLRSPDRTHYQLPELEEIVAMDISKIEISTPDVSVVLNKKDDRWHIAPEGYLADTEMVGKMLDVMEKLTVTALVSESKSYTRYDLDNEKTMSVKAWTGDKLTREFAVGKAATSYRHTFVKLSNDDGVYHAAGNFRGQFDLTVDKLRDKSVLSFDQTEIQEIHIAKDEEVIVLGRKEIPVEVSASQEADPQALPSPKVELAWQSADGRKADETKLSRLLTTLSTLKCEKYINDQKKEDLTSPIYTLQLKGVEEHRLSIFAKTDKEAKNYPAVSSANDYPFLLPEWQANNLMKKPNELLKKLENQ